MEGPQAKDLDQSQPGWYLALMAPNTLGPSKAWLDPTRLYLFPEAMKACVEDLCKPFKPEDVDLVAGIDAAGFILGSAIAYHLGKGFIALRKAGSLPIETDTQSYADYQGKDIPKCMEIRKNAFAPGTRVLIVDQWVETGGTMHAAAAMVERQQGVVAGTAVICHEESEGGLKLKQRFKCSHCVPTQELQENINNHTLPSFKLFTKASR